MMKIKTIFPLNIKKRFSQQLSKYDINNPLYNKVKKHLSEYTEDFINPIQIDLHSHLLPGIDDGVKTLDESISLIKQLKKLGYKKLITTPHIISDSYPNTKAIIEKKLFEVRDALKTENINIDIEAGAEHYIDMEFLKLLENNEVVPFCKKYILFETSYISKPIILEEAIFNMQSKGYVPVLAHPERYHYMQNDMDAYKQLKDAGVLFQINIKSLRNASGPVYDTTLKLIERGYADFIGSDAHRQRDINELTRLLKRKDYKMIFDKNTILNDILK